MRCETSGNLTLRHEYVVRRQFLWTDKSKCNTLQSCVFLSMADDGNDTYFPIHSLSPLPLVYADGVKSWLKGNERGGDLVTSRFLHHPGRE